LTNGIYLPKPHSLGNQAELSGRVAIGVAARFCGNLSNLFTYYFGRLAWDVQSISLNL